MITLTIRNASYLGAILVAGTAIAGASFAMWRSAALPTPVGFAAAPVNIPLVRANVGAPASQTAALVQPTPPAAATELRPAFDIVRIDPSGEAVIAGHAAADAAIELRSDGQVIANARSDGSGQFVILASAFVPGGHRLELTSPSSNGPTPLSSDAVAINVPGEKKIASIASPAKLSDSVPVAPGNSHAPATPIASLTASAPDTVAKDSKKTTVARGDSLWSISTHLLGGGEHYPQIHAANAAQIRNPQLIYPGQILLLPQSASTPIR